MFVHANKSDFRARRIWPFPHHRSQLATTYQHSEYAYRTCAGGIFSTLFMLHGLYFDSRCLHNFAFKCFSEAFRAFRIVNVWRNYACILSRTGDLTQADEFASREFPMTEINSAYKYLQCDSHNWVLQTKRRRHRWLILIYLFLNGKIDEQLAQVKSSEWLLFILLFLRSSLTSSKTFIRHLKADLNVIPRNQCISGYLNEKLFLSTFTRLFDCNHRAAMIQFQFYTPLKFIQKKVFSHSFEHSS